MDYFQKSLQISKELQDKKGMSLCFNNIGIIYQKQANWKIP